MPPSKNIVLFGLFGTNNLGNDATLTAVIRYLRDRHPEVTITCACAVPSKVARDHQVRTVALDPSPPPFVWRLQSRLMRRLATVVVIAGTEHLRRRATRAIMRGQDRLVVVGTGALDDFTTAPWEMPLDLHRWCKAAQAVGARVELLAVGAGPIHNGVSRHLSRRAVAVTSSRSYRDRPSLEYLRDRLGIDTADDPICPDLVFAYPEDALPPYHPPQSPPRIVGVGVMGYYGWQNSRDRHAARIFEAYVEKIRTFVKWLQRHGYGVRVLIGETGTDEEAARLLVETCNDGPIGTTPTWEPVATFVDLCAQIAQTDIVVASRFHNLVGALILGRPVISLGYSAKNAALLADFGLADQCQDITTFSVEELTHQFVDVARHHAQHASHIRKRADELRDGVTAILERTF